ncbi:LysE family translocator [Methylobacterium sp. BTF04]|nr:LysE family translocator [Methylobacterium sp. BTF04]
MLLSNLILFAAVYAVAVATPGPGVAAIVGRVLASGTQGVGWVIAGFVLADLIWFCVTAAGFAFVAQSFAPFFLVVKYGGALYLAYLAWKAWTTPVGTYEDAAKAGGNGLHQLVWGTVVSLGNPKVIMFFLAILPTAVALDDLTLVGVAELCAIITVVQGAILVIYVAATSRARRFVTSARAQRLVHRSAGAMMAGAAFAIAAR